MGRLRKISVGPGVAWVEAPQLGWSILCGCPADIVKTLKRKGLIRETEVDGRRCETGPNVILLSDVMLQNGAFCNLAEFPVLQMFYHQGMILPDHPNNTGALPLLIGSAKQVDAQLHYIYRGNYGLTGAEELAAAGLSEPLTAEIMAFKKRFAFGQIRHVAELLESRVLDNEPLELSGGLTVNRLGLNLFEFRLGEQRVEVDLNLAAGQTYAVPYELTASCANRDFFSIIHSGDGNGWDPNRPSMGSVLSCQGRIYLIDAGPNIQYTLDALGIGVNEIVGLFHTHCHDDHFAGLTTLLRADHRLQYFATPLVRLSVAKKLSALMGVDDAMFADCFEIHDLEFDQWNQVAGFDVMPLLSPHPVETNILLFRALAENGYKSYAHWADIAAREVLQGMVATDQREGISPEFFERVLMDYARPADVKKIDIGGGLIHGRAKDFNDDRSGAMLLSHTDRPLTADEQAIGTVAQFGRIDVLIASDQDYDRRDAAEFLNDYFPQCGQSEMAGLLNCPIRVDPPGTILLRVGKSIERLHLIISGTVERVVKDGDVGGGYTAGSLLGEMAGLADRPAPFSYRCRSHVKSLVIPVAMMREFLRRNALQDELLARAEARSFLRASELCPEALAETTMTRLAQALQRRSVRAGDHLDLEGELGLVASGAVLLLQGDETVESLGAGAVFNEEQAMFGQPRRWRAKAAEDGEICLLPGPLIRRIPLLRWTLLEILERRRTQGALPRPRTARKKSRQSC